MEAELAQLISNASTNNLNADDMPVRTEAEFVAQAQLAKAALEQFITVTTDPQFKDADLIKVGAMENIMKHTVGGLRCFFLFILSKTVSSCLSTVSPNSSNTRYFKKSLLPRTSL
jgi:hypothetical protein